jgi:hypothetical protein
MWEVGCGRWEGIVGGGMWEVGCGRWEGIVGCGMWDVGCGRGLWDVGCEEEQSPRGGAGAPAERLLYWGVRR